MAHNIFILTSSSDFGVALQKYLKSTIDSIDECRIFFNLFPVFGELDQLSCSLILIDFRIHHKTIEKFLAKLGDTSHVIPLILFNNEGDDLSKISFELNHILHCLDRTDADRNDPFFKKIEVVVREVLQSTSGVKRSSTTKYIKKPKANSSSSKGFKPQILAIGSSTGGPVALATVLKDISHDLPVPVVITQHMPAEFTKSLAQRLSKKCPIDFSEAVEGDVLKAGKGYVAPGGYHMVFEEKGHDVIVRLNQEELVNSCRPSVDVMFDSLVKIYGGNILAVILTGMGADGAKGCQSIKDLGGYIVIQDEETSVVWGMPGAVHALAIEDKELPLDRVGSHVNTTIMNSYQQ